MHRPAARDLQRVPRAGGARGAEPRAGRRRASGARSRRRTTTRRGAPASSSSARWAPRELTPGARRSAERGAPRRGGGHVAGGVLARRRRGSASPSSPPGRSRTSLVAFLILFLVFAVSGGPSNARRRPRSPRSRAGPRPPRPVCSPATASSPSTAGPRAVRRRLASDPVEPRRPVTLTVLRDGRRVTVGPRRTVKRDGHWIFGFEPRGADRPVLGRQGGQHRGLGPLERRDRHRPRTRGLFSQPRAQPALGPGRDRPRSRSSSCEVGLTHYLEILAFVSMSLALLNLLPLLPLDGGHILFSLIEARPPPRARARGLRARLGRRVRPHPARLRDRVLERRLRSAALSASASSEGAIRRGTRLARLIRGWPASGRSRSAASRSAAARPSSSSR